MAKEMTIEAIDERIETLAHCARRYALKRSG